MMRKQMVSLLMQIPRRPYKLLMVFGNSSLGSLMEALKKIVWLSGQPGMGGMTKGVT